MTATIARGIKAIERIATEHYGKRPPEEHIFRGAQDERRSDSTGKVAGP